MPAEKISEVIQSICIALPPSDSMISSGYGGIYQDNVIPAKMPLNVNIVSQQDDLFKEGYRFCIYLKELPGEIRNVIFNESLEDYIRNNILT